MVDGLYVMPGGWMDMARKWLVLAGGEDEVSLPMPYFLARAGDRTILVDAGCNPRVATDPASVWGEGVARHYRPRIAEEDLLVNRLAELDLQPADVTDVILTHMHMDHAGSLCLFPGVRVWVQLAEYRYAMHPDVQARSGYIKGDFDLPELDYRFLEGDARIMPGVHVITTPGHTPGHQSVLLNLREGGWTCLIGDAVYTRKILERRRMPGVVWNGEQTILTGSRLLLLEEAFGVRLVFNHDPDEYELLPKAPAALT